MADAEPDSAGTANEGAGQAIAALAGEGEHVADGRFTIDAEAALGKLEQFQVSDAQRWPVFLVEVAYLLDARGIDFTISGWTISASIAHAGVDPGLLDLLERFGEDRGQDDPARILGLVFRLARQAGADAITITAVGEDGRGRRCKWSAGGYARFEDCEESPGLRVWVRMSEDAEDPGTGELAQLNARCRASNFPITLDGQALSIGWVGAFSRFGAAQVSHRVEIVREGVAIGLAGVFDQPRKGRLLFMQHGVVVETQKLPKDFGALDRAFTAVVEVESRRDLSMTRFVRGPEFDAVMNAIRRSYTQVRSQARTSALALRDVYEPKNSLAEVDPDEHAEDLERFEQSNSKSSMLGGAISVWLGILCFGLNAAGSAIHIPAIIPLALMGLGVVLILRKVM